LGNRFYFDAKRTGFEMTEAIAAPKTLQEWQVVRQQIRAKLWTLLGYMPPIFTPQPTVVSRELRDGYVLEKIQFENGAGADVPGWVLIPDGAHRAPAILYNHAHGGDYTIGKKEIFEDRYDLHNQIGIEFVKRGYVVLAIDAYLFDERLGKGPGGPNEVDREAELTLAKKFLWEGGTLWGMMVRDDLLALNYLLTRPEVDPARIGTTGMSLGGSRTTWITALDDRIKVAIPVAQMNRYQEFAASGKYMHHGMYYYVPGALRSGVNMEHIAALAAPRAHLIMVGDSDALSPIEGVLIIDAFSRGIYDLYGKPDHFNTIIETGLAHQYTPSMFAATLDWFGRHL
jgi:dienelactone hydrolase